MYVNRLKVATENIYKGRTNASGNTIVKYVNSKRSIEVGIIPLDADVMADLQQVLKEFTVTISCINPETNQLENNVKCILSNQIVEYYTIQDSKVQFKAFSLVFKEL